MIELGQLEKAHEEFAKRNAQVVVISLEKQKNAQLTQADCPHLLVIADGDRKIAETLEVIHHRSGPDGGDTSAPTTILVDGTGTVRWTFRPDRFLTRLTPEQVLAALDEHVR